MTQPARSIPPVVAGSGAVSMALAAHALRASLGGVEILHGIELGFASGSWTSVVGPNGAGKSTLLKALAGLVPCSGSVALLGQPLHSYSARSRAQRLSWLGQNETGGDDLTVLDVVMLGRLPHQRWLASPNAVDLAACTRALQLTQAWAWRARALGELSGGERQRVLLARALATEADVFLMDEPLANLDPPHQADWLDAVRALVHSGKTVVSVLHEVGMALQADQMLILNNGQVAYAGACSNARTHRALETVFDNRISIEAMGHHFVALPTSGLHGTRSQF